jgi:lipoprotein-releasing system permease protein
MNIAHYIAKRIAFTKDKTFTKVIIRIAIAAIAISLAIMILSTAIINGFKKEISEKIFGFWGHIHITDQNITRDFDPKPIKITDSVFEDVAKIDIINYEKPASILGFTYGSSLVSASTFGGVKGVHPYIIVPSLMNTKDAFHGVLLKGLDKSYDWKRLEKFLINGNIIDFADTSKRQIIVSKIIAQKLNLRDGSKTVLSFIQGKDQIKKRFEVAGIFNTGLEEFDKRFCIVNIDALREILHWQSDEMQGAEVILDNVADLDPIADHIYYEKLTEQYFPQTIRTKFPSIFEWLNLQDINERIILILMLVVAIINMITVLLILILERSRMIGIIKSLGMSSWQVRKIFIYNAMYIIGFGLFWGNIFGLGLAFLQKYTGLVQLDEANYYLSQAPIEILWWQIIVLNLGVLILTLVFLIIPTMLVSKITPVKVLRFE